MKKIIKYLFVFLLLFNILTISVDALPVNMVAISENCDAILGDPNNNSSVAHLLQEAFNVIKFLTPILVLAFCTIEFIKATASQDKDMLQKATKNSFIRLIVGLIILVLPTLINFILELMGWVGTCGIK